MSTFSTTMIAKSQLSMSITCQLVMGWLSVMPDYAANDPKPKKFLGSNRFNIKKIQKK